MPQLESVTCFPDIRLPRRWNRGFAQCATANRLNEPPTKALFELARLNEKFDLFDLTVTKISIPGLAAELGVRGFPTFTTDGIDRLRSDAKPAAPFRVDRSGWRLAEPPMLPDWCEVIGCAAGTARTRRRMR